MRSEPRKVKEIIKAVRAERRLVGCLRAVFVPHTNPDEPADGREIPLLGVVVLDSAPLEHCPPNQARWVDCARALGQFRQPAQVRPKVSLTRRGNVGLSHRMILKADNKGRIAARTIFPPGSAFSVETDAKGRIVLTRLVKEADTPARVRSERIGGLTRLVSNRTVSDADVARALANFP